MTHTPGPWHIRRALVPSDGGHDFGIIATFDVKEHCIAEVFEVVDHGITLNAEANAKLIACAPTMYSYILGKSREGDANATEIINSLDWSECFSTMGTFSIFKFPVVPSPCVD